MFVNDFSQIDSGSEAFEKGNALAGRLHGEEAYADLNRAVIELNRAQPETSDAAPNDDARIRPHVEG